MWTLTPQQYEKILSIIDNHTKTMLYFAVGGQKPPIDLLRKLGIPESVIPMVKNAYVYGKLAQLMDQSKHKNLTFEQLKAEAKKVALTKQEQLALTWAERHAAMYVSGLANTIKNRVLDSMITDSKQSLAILAEKQAINDEVQQAIINRESRSQLVSNLRSITQDYDRDWQRVAHTELWDARLNGHAMAILSGGKDATKIRVFKRPRADACEHCKRLYLEADSITPRVFTLAQLMAFGDNYKKKMINWVPTLGTLHPNCSCTLNVLPAGFGFDKKGDLVFKGGG